MSIETNLCYRKIISENIELFNTKELDKEKTI